MTIRQTGPRTNVGSAVIVGLGRARRLRSAILAAAGLGLLLATMAVAIVFSQEQSRAQLRTNFALRATNSAQLVSTYLTEQAARQQHTARQFLSAPHVSAARFNLVVSAFGAVAADLLDRHGDLLAVVPSAPTLIGQQLATRDRHFEVAEQGSTVVSSVVQSTVEDLPLMAVAVPYATAQGRRVFSVAYRASGATLTAFVDHTIAYRQHEVFLIDATGRLLAASPRTSAETLAAADTRLAHAVAGKRQGSLAGKGPTTFTSAPVAGTAWRLVVAVPDSLLYNSVAGFSHLVPWLVFALVALLGILLVALLSRSLADRARLATLSAKMERTAQTDSLTGLYNRRALTEHVARTSAHARRHNTPLSVLMIDLDRFKRINDTFGHEAGDQVLCDFAGCMRDVFRVDDVYGRWGGDEFFAVLPATDADGAAISAARLITVAASVKLEEIGLADGIALSVGIATGILPSPQDLVREADLDLYRSKAGRRGRADGEISSRAPAEHA